MTPRQFERMVHDTAKRFSSRHKVKVSDESIREIIRPGLPHLNDVNRAMAAQKMTQRILSDSVYSILTNALLYANEIGQNHIGENTVQESMRRNCPYLFWC